MLNHSLYANLHLAHVEEYGHAKWITHNRGLTFFTLLRIDRIKARRFQIILVAHRNNRR